MICCVVLSLRLGKTCRLLAYRLNQLCSTSQGGECAMSLMLLSIKCRGSYSGDMVIDAWLPFHKYTSFDSFS
jgi:hypothetical protein